MKNFIILLATLFALEVTAQDRDTFTICKNTQIYTSHQDDNLTVSSNINFLHEVDLNNIIGVSATISIYPHRIDLRLNEKFNPLQFTEDLLDTLSTYLCNQPFERTSTGLTQGTIYDYGTRTPKEIADLEASGKVVIRMGAIEMSTFQHTLYDTVEQYGVALYLCDDDFEYGVDFKLLPTIRTIVKCRNCFTQTYLYNGFRFTFSDVIKARQLTLDAGYYIDGSYVPGWQDVDLTKYKEFIFIEKPKN